MPLSLLFTGVGFYIFLITEIPSVKALKDLTNKPVSTIYGINGQVVYVVVPDNKISVPYAKMPKYVREAFLAAEDADFFSHKGVEIKSIFRAFFMNVVHGRVVQGGSTITQQVIKALILGPEKSMMRKVREAILAYRLETVPDEAGDPERLPQQHLHGAGGLRRGGGVPGVFRQARLGDRQGGGRPAGRIVQAPARYTPRRAPRARQDEAALRDRPDVEEGLCRREEKRRHAEGAHEAYCRRRHIRGHLFQERRSASTWKTSTAKVFFREGRLRYTPPWIRRCKRAAEDAVKKGLAQYDERRGAYAVAYHLDKGRWEGFMSTADRDLALVPLISGGACNLLVSERVAGGYAVFAGTRKGLL